MAKNLFSKFGLFLPLKLVLPVLIHGEVVSFCRISREIRN
ncbi:hypothetical protein T11_14502 [Trichinella zimbabwensis]|uniref:Uncharacterized protein n=1 Tax=Trichinella zimbabwensis TaxID=268475 RepID=A0A0V1GP61_9BILA|nr:hypothetical protein T11_14502 [Trichinella zimbabwensis]